MTDLTGQRFGRLVVESYSTYVDQRGKWICRCDCGGIKAVTSGHLMNGDSRSCGCLRKEVSAARVVKHGKTETPEYKSWCELKARCLNPSNHAYGRYGGRGITVCERWLHSFENFFEDMGTRPTPKHSIDRIDVNGNYEPLNCRWGSIREQSLNRRNNHFITHRGQTQTLKEWSEQLGLNYKMIHNRIKKCGWSFERAITEPVRERSLAA